MFVSDIIYLIFLMVLLFLIIYKGFTFGKNSATQQEENNFNALRDELYYNRHCLAERADRQGNVFTISNETAGRDTARRYDDIFYIEPNSVEAERIRQQLEKDEKDLPTYEEVMRMTSVTPPPDAAAPASADAVTSSSSMPSIITASSSSVNTVDTTFTIVPPQYTEIDPNISSTSQANSSVFVAAVPPSVTAAATNTSTVTHASMTTTPSSNV